MTLFRRRRTPCSRFAPVSQFPSRHEDRQVIHNSTATRSRAPTSSQVRHSNGQCSSARKHRPISPSGRQDLNLRPLDPQACHSNPLDQRERRIPRSGQVRWPRLTSVQRSLQTMRAPVSLQQHSLQVTLQHPWCGTRPPGDLTHPARRASPGQSEPEPQSRSSSRCRRPGQVTAGGMSAVSMKTATSRSRASRIASRTCASLAVSCRRYLMNTSFTSVEPHRLLTRGTPRDQVALTHQHGHRETRRGGEARPGAAGGWPAGHYAA